MIVGKENILIVAGEVSGDMHGAEVLKELRKTNPHLEAFGIGGDELIKNGLHALYHINKMAFLGFVEVVRHLPFIAKVKRELAALVKEKNITTAILIDYPGFNLNFARLLKKMNVKIIYYISPQLWAWGKGRISKIKKLVNTMLVVFPFEETMYRGHGINAEFVGHPLVEQIGAYKPVSKQELYAKYGLDEDKDVLLVLPGSREQEVRLIYPAMAEGVEKLAQKYNMQIVLACAPLIDSAVFEQLYKSTMPYKVVHEHVYEFMQYAKFGIVKSGTSTLQAGIFGLPMIIVYKTNPLTFEIGKRLVKIDYIGLANIVSGGDVVPELIQGDVSTKKIVEVSSAVLDDENRYRDMKNKLGRLRSLLGEKHASVCAAAAINRVMHEN